MNATPPLPPPEEAPLPSSDVGTLLARSPDAAQRAGRKRGQKLFSFGTAAVAVALAYYGLTANVADPVHLYFGLLIFVLAAVPSLLWAKRARYSLPLFEAFLITGVNTYAIPILGGHETLKLYDNDTILTAAFAIIIFQLTAIIAYFAIRTRPKRGRLWRTEIVSRGISRALGYGMIITTAYTIINQFTDWIPSDLVPEFRAACYGMGIIATFVQCRRWGQGDLPHHDKAIFLVQLFIQVVFTWVSLFLVQGVSMLLLALLGYVSGGKRLPFLAIVVCLPIIGVLFNGKSTMRARYWDAGAAKLTITQLPDFFSEWVSAGLAVSRHDEGAAKNAGVLDRTSLIQMMCLVTSTTPDQKPYLMGETYAQVLPQLVPRFFWKGKPLGSVSTSTLSVYYGLQSSEETMTTTIGFGMPAEAYANFGYFGVAALGLVFGLFFNKVTHWCAESPIFSYPGLFTIVLMAWTFQTEAPLSGWLSSMVQACECVIGLPFVLKNFL